MAAPGRQKLEPLRESQRAGQCAQLPRFVEPGGAKRFGRGNCILTHAMGPLAMSFGAALDPVYTTFCPRRRRVAGPALQDAPSRRTMRVMASETATKKPRKPRAPKPLVGAQYLRLTHRPLVCFMFLLPILVFYETGTFLIQPYLWEEAPSRVIAADLLQDFFGLFGATPYYLPGLAVLAVLLAWHIAQRDPWEVDWRVVGLMFVESCILALPLLAINNFVHRQAESAILAAVDPAADPFRRSVQLFLLSMGAGIYEELVFRLILISALNVIFIDILGRSKAVGFVVAIVLSAVLFSAYHYLGNETFSLWTFIFRSVAGVYLALCFIFRGFGIAVGSHAAYDVIATLLGIVHEQ